jgi:hypothetical protein
MVLPVLWVLQATLAQMAQLVLKELEEKSVIRVKGVKLVVVGKED